MTEETQAPTCIGLRTEPEEKVAKAEGLHNRCSGCWEPLPLCCCTVPGEESSRTSARCENKDSVKRVSDGLTQVSSDEFVKLLAAGTISSLEFYPQDEILHARLSANREVYARHISKQTLQEVATIARGSRTQITSHFQKHFSAADDAHGTRNTCIKACESESDSIDENWEFVQNQLHDFCDQMQQQALDIYGTFLVPEACEAELHSLRVLSDGSRTNAIEAVVKDTVAGLLSSVSAETQEKMEQYTDHMHGVVETRVIEMFASVERNIVKSTSGSRTSGIRSRNFPSQMQMRR